MDGKESPNEHEDDEITYFNISSCLLGEQDWSPYAPCLYCGRRVGAHAVIEMEYCVARLVEAGSL